MSTSLNMAPPVDEFRRQFYHSVVLSSIKINMLSPIFLTLPPSAFPLTIAHIPLTTMIAPFTSPESLAGWLANPGIKAVLFAPNQLGIP